MVGKEEVRTIAVLNFLVYGSLYTISCTYDSIAYVPNIIHGILAKHRLNFLQLAVNNNPDYNEPDQLCDLDDVARISNPISECRSSELECSG